MPGGSLFLGDILRFLPPMEGLAGLRSSLTASSSTDEDLRWSRTMRYVTLDARRVDRDRFEHALARSMEEEQERVRRLFTRAGEMVEALSRGDEAPAAEILLEMGAGELERGRHHSAVAILERAVEVASTLRDRKLEGRALRVRAKALWKAGTLEPALAHYHRARSLAAEGGQVDEEVRALQGQGNVLAAQGRWPEAWDVHLEALRRTEGEDPEFRLLRGQTYNNLSQVARRMGRVPEATGYQQAAARIWRDVDSPHDRLVHLNNQGLLHLARDEIVDAREVFAEGLRQAGGAFPRAVFLTNLAQAALADGEPQEAEALAREAEEHAVEAGAEDVLVEIYLVLGTALRERGDDLGITFFEKALELAGGGPYLLMRARVHLEYGRLRREADDEEEARAHFEEARKIAARLGAAVEHREAEGELVEASPR